MSKFLLGLISWLSFLTFAASGDTDLCRCEASYEHFYSRRLDYYHYDYKNTYMDDDGYYIVDGVRVLPSYDEACVDNGNHMAEMSDVFDRLRRGLQDVETTDYEDEELVRALHSTRKAKSKGKSKKYSKFGSALCPP